MAKRLFAAFLLLILSGVFGGSALAQAPARGPMAAPTAHVEVAPLPPAGVAHFDAMKATDAYLATISPKDKARSDAYFEGKYVLQLVDLLYGLAVAAILLWLHLSSGMRNFATRITRYRFLQVPIYVVQYVVVTTVLTLPLMIYEGFYREHQYGLSNQTFLQWAGEQGISFLVSLVAFTVLLTVIYSVARKAQRYWWVWGAGITIAFMMFFIMISPVYIAPLFNNYTPLPDSAMKSAILSMAHSNGIPADDVYAFDASKQSKRVSANVSGLFGTTRISLNDNLLNRCTPSEILHVMGHEMGHYVMNHIVIILTWFGMLILLGFWFIDKAFHWLLKLFGKRWGVESLGDPAGLPVIMALLSVYLFLMTPVTNTIIRTQEVQADLFGLNLARQPDGAAKADLKLVEYRKADPGPIEEFIFFDHPSARSRILMAMRWKAEHINDPDIMAGPISPQ